MSFTASSPAGRRGARFSAGGLLAAAVVAGLAAPAGASTAASAAAAPGAAPAAVHHLHLHAMPAGTVTFGRTRQHRLTVRAHLHGLTPGSAHAVQLTIPGRRSVRFSPLTAASSGHVTATLHSSFTGPLPRGGRLVIRMGRGRGIARSPIARTWRLTSHRTYRLHSVEVSRRGATTPRGRATISYNASRQTLTVTVHASGISPGFHAAHIHQGSCFNQGPVLYMLKDLHADRHGRIAHAVRVFTKVTKPIPAHGWYLNIHQGNSSKIATSAGQPTIYFRPLLCSDIKGAPSISSILQSGDVVTGVRGESAGNVILTGLAPGGSGDQARPFLFRGRLNSSSTGAAVSVRTPAFPKVTTATFYGPDTHKYNPASIPAGQVRAVGSYQSSAAPSGVLNQGMIYRGPVSGPGGSWTSIAVPAHGSHTTGHRRACPRTRPKCFVMETIAHSTMGNLVVGNYDLNPTIPGGLASGNGFIYNMTRHQWTLMRLGGSQSSKTTLYGIWQNGGDNSVHYTLAGGSSAHGRSARGPQRAYLVNYNERTGAFGKPHYYRYANSLALATHFEGITAVPGGFNLVALSSAQPSSLAFVPVRHGSFGTARWHPVPVAQSQLCPGGCSIVTGNTVHGNQVMGLYVQSGSKALHTYLASVPGR